MSQKNFNLFTAILFLIGFVVHLLRLIFGWEVLIAGITLPVWLSALAIVLAGILSYQGFKYFRKLSHAK